MESQRARKAEQLYHAALSHESAHRDAYLVGACGNDEELLHEVQLRLIQHPSALSRKRDLASAVDGQHLASGARLGPYRIEVPIGAGGMGEVFRAKDTRLLRTVAIKVLSRAGLSDPATKARFLREARAASALDHPNIVRVYDISSDGDVDFLVMEYVSGEMLKKLIPPVGMSLSDVVQYGVQIANGLAAAHAAGIVHRDIKPANIMVTADSQIKILDFGIAKLFGAVRLDTQDETLQTNLTQPGILLGTICYMSPEQIRGEPLDGRSDIFSLGCVLYQALTGQFPFNGPATLAILTKIVHETPPLPCTLRPDLPPEVDRMIERALAKQRDQRYSSALELGQALNALMRPGVGSVQTQCSPREPAAQFTVQEAALSGAPAENPTPVSRGQLARRGVLAMGLVAAGALLVRKIASSRGEGNSAALAVKLELSYFILVQRYKNGQPFRDPFRLAGEILFQEDYRIAIQVEPLQPGFLYVLNEGPLPDGSPSISMLRPAHGVTARIPAGGDIRIPEKEWFVFDQSSGVETLYLAWSMKEVPEFEMVKDRMDSLLNNQVVIRDPPQIAALQRTLTENLLPASQARKDVRSERTLLFSERPVLVHAIRLEHH